MRFSRSVSSFKALQTSMALQQIQPQQLQEWLADASRHPPVLLDVREPWEFEVCHLPGSLHMPMSSLASKADELDPDSDIVVICHHGARSVQVAAGLARRGFTRLHNLSGGVDAWARQIEPAMATY
jgi:rhodanese-related sulfurtransferase